MNHATEVILNNPAWAALTTKQAHLRQGERLAFRYHPDTAPFAAVASETREAFQELGQLLLPHETVALQTLDPLPSMEAVQAERIGVIRQMVAERPPSNSTSDDIVRLNDSHAEEMLELAQRTKPGPFGKRTHETGNYIGIRDHGCLIAMAGERMRLDGFVEISAVCVDAEYRGRGLAGRLMNVLSREIGERGDTPFLHVFDDNHSAVALYERLGFASHQTFSLYRIKRGE
jgi:predicted GNAT family acetyltransferase